MQWIVQTLRQYPELAIFFTLAAGFYVGNIKIGKFSLGTVTSILLIGVLVGQLDIKIDLPAKSIFFLMFLFAVGYSVGPQFFKGLKKEGLPQMGFSVLMLIFCLLVPWACAKIMGYDKGQAAGLLSGSQTISAVIGVAGDTIQNLEIPAVEKKKMIDFIPVGYAVTYIFGTAGSAWILSILGPKLLGGLEKVRQQCKELEKTLGNQGSDNPSVISADIPIVVRAYKIENDLFEEGKTVEQLESFFRKQDKSIFVERIRSHGEVLFRTPEYVLRKKDEIVISGPKKDVLEIVEIGEEIYDSDLLNLPMEVLNVFVTNKGWDNKSVADLRSQQYMSGVVIKSIKRSEVELPVLNGTVIHEGDLIRIVGRQNNVDEAAAAIGYAERPTSQTDMIFVGLGIFLGGLIGALTLRVSGVPLSLSTSGGALIFGLIFGWLRGKHPAFGNIPAPALWMMNNVGLDVFIAIVGITAGPGFVQGFQEVGFSLFLVGAVATGLPLIIGLLIGRYLFKFHPAINLGCVAGARTTTAALGALEEALQSKTAALGYTVTYAVGNTLLIIWGVIIVLMT